MFRKHLAANIAMAICLVSVIGIPVALFIAAQLDAQDAADRATTELREPEPVALTR